MQRIFVPSILIALCSFLISSCDLGNVSTKNFTSPGGLYSATLKIRDGGACCSSSASVTLHDINGRIGSGDLIVFEGIGGWPIDVHWTGPSAMVVEFCDGAEFEVKSRTFEKNIMKHSGGQFETRVTVQVATTSQTIAGQIYCDFGPPKVAAD